MKRQLSDCNKSSNRRLSSAKYDIYSSSKSHTVPSSVTTTVARTDRSCVIAAVVEGRGLAHGEIGLASMDLRHPELCLAQFSDVASYDRLRIKLHILNPTEIVMPETALEQDGNMNHLYSILKSDFPAVQIIPAPRKIFNDNVAIEAIQSLKTPDCTIIEKDIKDKYYGLACVAALLSYVENIQNIVFSSQSVRIIYNGLEKTCMIDPATAKNLELLVSLKNANDTEGSLFGVINHTVTAGGQRMLKANILQPSTDTELILQRYDAVEELLNDERAFNNLRNTISRMLDVDRLVVLCSHVPKKETVKWAEYKIGQLINLKHTLELVGQLRERLQPFNSTLFESYYQSNLNGLLDLARRTYCELINEVQEVCSHVREETGIPFKIGFTSDRGFYMQIHVQKGNFPKSLPEVLINLNRKNNLITCTTRDLVQLNDRINEVKTEIIMMSNVVITDLLASIRNSVVCLFNLTEVVSCCDMLTCLAYNCTIAKLPMCRATFSDTLALKSAWHPLLNKLSFSPITPNDVYVGPEANFVLITGPNMMTDVNYILQNFDNDSLVVIDELARSTSAEEGYALSHAICEQFIASKAFVILSTHFLDLARLDSLYPNVEKLSISGFEIASLSKFPKQVIERAKEFAAEMRAKGNLTLAKDDPETRRKRAVMKLGFRLAHIKQYYKEVDITVLRNHLKNLKTEYLREIAECDAIINIAGEL